MKSDELMAKIEEKRKNRNHVESVAQTLDFIVDSVCSSISSKKRRASSINRIMKMIWYFFKASSCLSVELSTKHEIRTPSFNDQMNILISHLSDDEDTRQVRLLIKNRYEQLMSIVDNKIKTILLEHQSNYLFLHPINNMPNWS